MSDVENSGNFTYPSEIRETYLSGGGLYATTLLDSSSGFPSLFSDVWIWEGCIIYFSGVIEPAGFSFILWMLSNVKYGW